MKKLSMKKLSKLTIIGFLLAGGVQATTYHVTVNGFTYSSDMPVKGYISAGFQPYIKAGDRIIFSASGFHPLRFDLNDFANGGAGCDSDCAITFAEQPVTSMNYNVYTYYCQNHGGAGMNGRFHVEISSDLLFIGDFETPVVKAGVGSFGP